MRNQKATNSSFRNPPIPPQKKKNPDILQFAWWKCKAKKNVDGHWNRYGPCYLLMAATVLVLIQPTCMLVIGAYGSDDDCDPENPQHHGMENFFFEGDDTQSLVPDTTVGWMIQIFGTYLGFIFMFTGVVWSTNLHKKIAKKWSKLGLWGVGGRGIAVVSGLPHFHPFIFYPSSPAIIQANRRGLAVQQ